MSGLVVVFASAWLLASRDPERYFARRQGRLAASEVQSVASAGGFRTESLRLKATSGFEVDAKVRFPEGGVSLPAIVILGGHRTGRDAVDLVEPNDGFVVAALSYPHDEERWRKGIGLLAQLPDARRALFDAAPALSLLADHLLEQREVAAERIELVGVSLGAPIVTVAGARDPRFARVWAIHGGGAPGALLEHNLRDEIEIGWLRRATSRFGAALVAPLAPERHAAKISPRELVLVNAESDERIPRRCVDALYDSALEPKELVWLPGAHVDVKESEQIAELVALVAARVNR